MSTSPASASPPLSRRRLLLAAAGALFPAPPPDVEWPLVPLIFPILGPCRWSDTWGAPRDGGRRKHIGQDLPAPKMRPLLACFDGVWYGAGIEGDAGWSASYFHINNDTPGTDDGRGADEFAWAPGVRPGTRVIAGQHVAYCGDSGNAEETISHLHFELHGPNGPINAARSLHAAQRLSAPRYRMEERSDVAPAAGEVRFDAEVCGAPDPGRGVVPVRVAAWRNVRGKVTVQTAPKRRWVKLAAEGDGLPPGLLPGDFVSGVGRESGTPGGPFAARRLVLLRSDPRRRAPTSPPGSPLPPEGGAYPDPAPPTPLPPAPPPDEVILFDFETAAYDGWQLEGDCWGRGPEGEAFAGGQLAGWAGRRFATSAHAGRTGGAPGSGAGRALSPPFRLTGTELHLLVAGGNHPDRCCVRLWVGGEAGPAASATGETPGRLRPVVWDVRPWRGRDARIEVLDQQRTGPHAYIHVDHIRMTGVREPA